MFIVLRVGLISSFFFLFKVLVTKHGTSLLMTDVLLLYPPVSYGPDEKKLSEYPWRPKNEVKLNGIEDSQL